MKLKYIDTEKLKAEIERLKEEYTDIAIDSQRGWVNANYVIDDLEQLQSQIDSLQQEQLVLPSSLDEAAEEYASDYPAYNDEQIIAKYAFKRGAEFGAEWVARQTKQGQSEVDLEKFTEKMDDWKARYNYPDSIPIKATMAFTARMFYMYPDAARQWYDSLPKATQD